MDNHKKPDRKRKEKKRKPDTVIAPGGPRDKNTVHPVKPGEVVRQEENGTYTVIKKSQSLNKESTMQENFVITPGGYRPRENVHQIDPGYQLRLVKGNVQLLDPEQRVTATLGKIMTRRKKQPLMPENVVSQMPISAAFAQVLPALGAGWITYSGWTNDTGSPITSFLTTWMVPPAPRTDSGQTIFLFNGIQNSTNIYQPVLQWGRSAAGGGNFWSIASWYVDGPTGPAFFTNLIQVNPGDVLVGRMTLTGQVNTQFSYNCDFVGIANTSLPVMNIQELTWCCETLEAYAVQSCTDYPDVDLTQFTNIEIRTREGTPELDWTAFNAITDCEQHCEIVSNANPGGQVDLYYRFKRFDVGTFSPWAGYAIPNGVWLAGDFNGDGRSDLAHIVEGADWMHTWMSNGNGTFNVGTFQPWGGYAMPNGVWLVGDFNGDGRSDLVHIVQGADWMHTWMSNGDGTFNVGTFQPWPGYAMPNGVWLVGDFNGDGRSDLAHIVEGADWMHTWMSNGDGTFNVGTFQPWPGYGMPNGVWLVGDLNGDGRSDLFHVVQGADWVHTWMSNGDGTYYVGTFSPWAGYAMPNGLWLPVDLNGNGCTDFVHAVEGADWAHTWMSNGNGTFSVGTFSPWPGYAIPNGVWLGGDFNGNGRADIFHAVQNSDWVHTWSSNGNGTFDIRTFSPGAGYAIPNGIWLAGDFTGDGRTDIVHGVQNTNYVHVWRSQPGW